MSANIKASVDGTQAIIGVGGVDQMTVSNAGVVTANSFVGAMNGSSVTATGSTTARTLANRFADVVNVKDFGAVGDGVADDTAAIQAAVNSLATSGIIFIPKGIYKLNTNVVNSGKLVSYNISPEASFSGSGILENPTQFGFYYNSPSCKIQDSKLSLLKEDNKNAATAVFAKYSTANAGPNPAIFALCRNNSLTQDSVAQGIYSEAHENAGIFGTYAEGGRFLGVSINPNADGNSVYGIISVAQSGTSTTPQKTNYVIGVEAEVISYDSRGSAPHPRLFTRNNFDATFLSSVGFSNSIDASYLINPFNSVTAQAGFVVPKGAPGINPGDPDRKTVDKVAFGCYEKNLEYGLDLALGSYTFAAIALPNASPIRSFNSAYTSEKSILVLTGTDSLSIGCDIGITHINAIHFNPATTNTYDIGSAGTKWREIFATNGTINTSDVREKQQIEEISSTEKNVAIKLKSLLKKYKFNHAVEKKGDKARIHFGVMAQDVKEAFESEGLDANKYGIFCYDEWESRDGTFDENGNILVSPLEAGNSYGVRYNELFAFIIASL